jgi:hypothetical protein
VNQTLALFKDRPLKLVGEFIQDSNKVKWLLEDFSCRTPLEKASGFQKAIMGLAVRAALRTLGSSQIMPTQIFIDEASTLTGGPMQCRRSCSAWSPGCGSVIVLVKSII